MHKVQYYNPTTKQWSKKQKMSKKPKMSKSKENEDDLEDDMIIIGML